MPEHINAKKFGNQNLNKRYHMKRIHVNVRIILKWILRIEDGRVQLRLI
jgi:hypothetical protein